MATLVRKSFTDKQIKQIARKYIFGKGMTYKKLAEMHGCSDSKISYLMNHDLLDISKILFFLVEKKAQYNKKKVRKMLNMKKK